MATSYCSLWSRSTWSLAARIQRVTGREGKKRRQEKGISLGAFLLPQICSFGSKRTETLFVSSQSIRILPCDFPRPQFPVIAPTARGKQKVHTTSSWGAQGSARMTAQCFTMASRPFLSSATSFTTLSKSAWFSVALSHSLSPSCSYIQEEIQLAATSSFFQLAYFLSKNSLRPWCCPSSCFFLRITFNSFLTRTLPCSIYCFSINTPSRTM